VIRAHATVRPDAIIGDIDRRLFGSFVEHLGRCVYDGIYEPGHATADADGFREDVLELVRELGVTSVRYPGGNFVSGYRWEDGVGPRNDRPKRVDLAWHSLETNEVGLNEFARWVAKSDTELMLAVNLGTRGVQEALDLYEYTNLQGGTAWSDMRAEHGAPDPHGVTMWCLGNEMDGPWQLGHRSADDYGKIAAQTARGLKQFDPTLQLVACGSSARSMPTFGAWERTVLEHCYDDVDYISCHAYYNLKKGDLAGFLASPIDMDRFIEEVGEAIDEVRAFKGSEHEVRISFDEWNVWDIERYHAEDKVTDPQVWPVAPRLLEDSYTVADAVVVGGLLMSLLRNVDRVAAASLAQLVNVIAPIMTEPGGLAWKQTTFFPFATASRLARGQSVTVDVDAPTYASTELGSVPLIDVVVTRDGATAVVFATNRSIDESATLEVDLGGLSASRIDEAWVLADDDVTARNTLDDPERVGLRPLDSAVIDGGVLRLELPPVSWVAITLT
jgi:alpha-N-arabinofuranosidase